MYLSKPNLLPCLWFVNGTVMSGLCLRGYFLFYLLYGASLAITPGMMMRLQKTGIIIYTILFLLFAWQFYTNKLLQYQDYDEVEKDYTLFLFLLATAGVVLLMLLDIF